MDKVTYTITIQATVDYDSKQQGGVRVSISSVPENKRLNDFSPEFALRFMDIAAHGVAGVLQELRDRVSNENADKALAYFIHKVSFLNGVQWSSWEQSKSENNNNG